MARTKITVRIVRILRGGNFGDHREHISGPLSELRINYGPRYRVYYVLQGGILVVLVGGSTKETQQDDVVKAVALWEENRNDPERF